MEKQTKNVITRDFVAKELKFFNTADIRSILVLCGGLSLVFLPLTFGLVYGILCLFEALLLKIILSFVVGVIISAPVWINLLTLPKILAERALLLKGDFEITVKTVLYKNEKIVRRHTEGFLHFEGFKECSVGNTTFQLTSEDDEFYIVHYRSRDSIKLLYFTKIYEYKED